MSQQLRLSRTDLVSKGNEKKEIRYRLWRNVSAVYSCDYCQRLYR